MPEKEYQRRADIHKSLMRQRPGYSKLYQDFCEGRVKPLNGAWFHKHELCGEWDGTKIVGAAAVDEVLRSYGIEGAA